MGKVGSCPGRSHFTDHMTVKQTMIIYIGCGSNMCNLIWLTCRPCGVPIENQRGQGGGLPLFWNRVIKTTAAGWSDKGKNLSLYSCMFKGAQISTLISVLHVQLTISYTFHFFTWGPWPLGGLTQEIIYLSSCMFKCAQFSTFNVCCMFK